MSGGCCSVRDKTFEHRIAGGKQASSPADFRQTEVDRLNGVGRVNHFAEVCRVVKEQAQAHSSWDKAGPFRAAYTLAL